MKTMKKRLKKALLITPITMMLALFFAQSVFAGVSVDYYSWTIQFQNNNLYGELFTNTNPNPSILGKQDGACNANTIIEYALVKKGDFGDTIYGAAHNIPYDYITQTYSYQWYGVDTNKQMQIRITNKVDSCSASGSGNVYN
ncbi:hypothetical protein GZH47_20950 [Paenibacillus rhizovicinus]|uniref:Secreted protein n=1 Tax=Paenibacillus rhizovicinus TaxID=2704463 RepID=A0A6C0P3V5_9BACL|nr:hypothetical protein [Paenibacillus rhizovicinus]QHW33021.1 hypothetical protein GZH47_20950 [Paenibacillus rhizovicinus]